MKDGWETHLAWGMSSSFLSMSMGEICLSFPLFCVLALLAGVSSASDIDFLIVFRRFAAETLSSRVCLRRFRLSSSMTMSGTPGACAISSSYSSSSSSSSSSSRSLASYEFVLNFLGRSCRMRSYLSLVCPTMPKPAMS